MARPGGSFDARVVDAACKPRASEDARAEVGHPRDERAAGVAFSNCLCHGVITTGRTRPSDLHGGFRVFLRARKILGDFQWRIFRAP